MDLPLEKHPVVGKLQELLPEVKIFGGTFRSWLPDPHSIGSEERLKVLSDAKLKAVDLCIGEIKIAIGVSSQFDIHRGSDGDRQWPPGYMGSITHKGTVELAAIAKNIKSVGIDLERDDGKSLGNIRDLVGLNEIPAGSGISSHMIFSVKESVFKAQFPITKKKLGFGDIKIVWKHVGTQFRGEAVLPTGRIEVRAGTLDKWIYTCALIKSE